MNQPAFFAHGVAWEEISARTEPMRTIVPGRRLAQSMPDTVTFSPASPGLDGMALVLQRGDDVRAPEAQRLEGAAVVTPVALHVPFGSRPADLEAVDAALGDAST